MGAHRDEPVAVVIGYGVKNLGIVGDAVGHIQANAGDLRRGAAVEALEHGHGFLGSHHEGAGAVSTSFCRRRWSEHSRSPTASASSTIRMVWGMRVSFGSREMVPFQVNYKSLIKRTFRVPNRTQGR